MEVSSPGRFCRKSAQAELYYFYIFILFALEGEIL